MAINDEIVSINDIIVKSVDPEKVYLFGSYAYGTPHKDSDYDFYAFCSKMIHRWLIRPI
ncbi:hypothetical protein FACS1894137_17010 [Spirochaetia bacterium]|nr:hypothetical protein FACS1894137_17010 [Spirochaetia bacterium]